MQVAQSGTVRHTWFFSQKSWVKQQWVKTECRQTAYKTQIKNLYVKKRRTNLQILECKKYLCNPPPLAQIFVHYTNTTQTGIAIFSTQSPVFVQSSGKRRREGENFIWKSVRCLVARMVGSWVLRSIDGAMTGAKRSILAAIFCTTWSIVIWNNAPHCSQQ